MNADCAFVIGKTHAICQDYVVANPAPYVVLSDGCSSSPDTDIGARLLVKSTEQFLKGTDAKDISIIHERAATDALELAWVMGLAPQAVDATLLTAHVEANELIVACSGDGVVVLQKTSGVIEAYSISYPSGYPNYPTYTKQPDRLASLDCSKEVRCFRGTSNGVLQLAHTHTSDDQTEVMTFKASDYKFAVLLSDGIHSFSSTNDAGSCKIEFQTIARDLVAFKNVRGEFAARRLKRFLKDATLKGWQHADDLSVGAIYLGE